MREDVEGTGVRVCGCVRGCERVIVPLMRGLETASISANLTFLPKPLRHNFTTFLFSRAIYLTLFEFKIRKQNFLFEEYLLP